jgi:RES domain-containing protein
MADVTGWRIVKQKHAATAFSGEGARLFEGRWNLAGVPMVYCSEHLSLAALEILVHTQAVTIRDKFRAFRVLWDTKLMISIDLKQLPNGWNFYPPSAASKNVGSDWIKSGRTPVLAVPSVIVPLERTFLLNPKHSDFQKIKIQDAGTFILDQRLRR